MKLDTNPLFRKFEYPLTIIASLSSIIALVLLIFQDKAHSIIALISFLLFLLFISFRIYIALKKLTTFSHPDGYIQLSTSVGMSTEDGKHFNYEVYKHLQCKQPILTEFPYKYKWSGTKSPVITSNIQKIDGEIIRGDKSNYDCIKLKFNEPIFYNEMALIHVSMKLDDSDERASTRLETKIDKPVKMLQQKVELKHKDSSYTEQAVLKKKAINTTLNLDFEVIDYIKFDPLSKSYMMCLINPEPGYFYRLEWKR